MQKFCGCRVATFGAKPSGFVLEVADNEAEEEVFFIKQYRWKEVEEHLECEETEFVRLDIENVRKMDLNQLVKLAEQEICQKNGKEEDLLISARVIHKMCAVA